MAKVKTEVISLTANEVWELRREWHRKHSELDIILENKRHIAVCDALESWARELEGEHITHFTGKVFDFRKKEH